MNKTFHPRSQAVKIQLVFHYFKQEKIHNVSIMKILYKILEFSLIWLSLPLENFVVNMELLVEKLPTTLWSVFILMVDGVSLFVENFRKSLSVVFGILVAKIWTKLWFFRNGPADWTLSQTKAIAIEVKIMTKLSKNFNIFELFMSSELFWLLKNSSFDRSGNFRKYSSTENMPKNEKVA